jgi:transposase
MGAHRAFAGIWFWAQAKICRRRIVNAILYIAHTGCQWRQLPHDMPVWTTVYSCYHRWSWNGTLDKIHAAVRAQVRVAANKKEQPTAASVDSQSVKTVAKGGPRAYCNAATMAPRS